MNKFVIAAFATSVSLSPAVAQHGDATRGQRDFQACAPCHSLEPDRNMTGPSLADLWGRKAGGLSSFDRYSNALKSSGIIWDDRALDGWLTDPQAMVPDNDMPFEGIKDARVRAGLLAFLKEATKPGAAQQTAQQGGMKGMGGMMGGGRDPKLKSLKPGKQVKAITYCHDTYRVTTADGKTRPSQPAVHHRLQQGWTGERCAGDHAGRHVGRQSFGDLRSAGGDHQDNRSAMLLSALTAEWFGPVGVGREC